MLKGKITHPTTNERVDIFISQSGLKPTLNLVYKEQQRTFLIRDPEFFTSFFQGMTNEWLQFCLINSNQFLLDEGGIMDEFVLILN